MPGKLSTHVLDTTRGRPAAGVTVSLWRRDGATWTCLAETTTNADGRTHAPLIAGDAFIPATYELRFAVGAYFALGTPAGGPETASPAFLEEVPVRFVISDASINYHIPLLVTPWSYSTYRGS